MSNQVAAETEMILFGDVSPTWIIIPADWVLFPYWLGETAQPDNLDLAHDTWGDRDEMYMKAAVSVMRAERGAERGAE